jgi:hypothetical protein
MSHASQETVDSDANNAAMPDDRKRGAGAPFAKVDLTRSHGIGASLHAPCLPPDIVEDPNVKAMEPQEPHKKRHRKKTIASRLGTSHCGWRLCQTLTAWGLPM